MSLDCRTYKGFRIHVVEAGTVIEDPLGRSKPVTIDDTGALFAGQELICTASTAQALSEIVSEEKKPSSQTDKLKVAH